MKRIVIAGGGYAGILAANRLAVQSRKEGYSITLINASETFVERIRDHQAGAGQPLPRMSVRELLRAPVAFLHDRIESIDAVGKTVGTQSGFVPYDALIYAPGSEGRPSFAAENSYCIGAPGEADRLRRALASAKGSVVVLGAGLTGIETSTELAEARPDLSITVVHAGNLDREYSQKGANHLRKVFRRLQIRLLEDTRIQAIRPSSVLLADGRTLPADMTIQSGGLFGSPLARISGLPVNDRDQLLVDETLMVPDYDGLFGAGDAIALPEGYGFMRMGCVTAMPLGAHAAGSVSQYLAGEKRRAFRFGFPGRSISLGRNDGLIQFTDSFDRPVERVITGRSAAFIKEQVCRYTVRMLRLERTTGWKVFRWPQGQLQTAN